MTAMAALRELGLGLVAIVFPPHCAVCEEPAATALCDACAAQAWRDGEEPAVLPGLDGVASGGEHAGPLREAILALKFERGVLVRPLGEVLARRLAKRQPVWSATAHAGSTRSYRPGARGQRKLRERRSHRRSIVTSPPSTA